MRIAFYAPMKPPDHPRPSGDRRVAQLLMQALRDGGHRVELISRFRSWNGRGDAARLQRLHDVGDKLARRLIKILRARPPIERPQLWFTYHLYYKAPDFIGPAVARALSIPYIVAEASVANKRADGPFALGHQVILDALGLCDAAINLNPGDSGSLPPEVVQRTLKPFIEIEPFAKAFDSRDQQRSQLAARFDLDPRQPWLLAVAMMREGDKLESYRLLASALRGLPDLPWQLLVAGDGPMRGEVEKAFRAFASGQQKRVRFLGEVKPEAVPELCAGTDLMVWPAVGEAFGMALLEAQAAGTPVVAGRSEGVASIVRDSHTGILTKIGDAAAFAAAVRTLLTAPAMRRQMSMAAAKLVAEEHSLPAASQRLSALLAEITGG